MQQATLEWLVLDRVLVVNCSYGSQQDRAGIEYRRDLREQVAKQNTAVSSHWGNKTLEQLPKLKVFRSEQNCKCYKGLALFSDTSINNLFSEIDRAFDISRKKAMLIEDMRKRRP